MKIIRRIAVAELKTLFYSPIAWILLLIFGVQCSLFYISKVDYILSLQNMGEVYRSSLHFLTKVIFGPPFGVFSAAISKVYLYIPLLTMGLISRETSSGTIKLLYSSPVSAPQIVLGKFLSIALYNLLMLSFLVVHVGVTLLIVDQVDAGYLFTCMLGIYLLLCVYSAIGLFMSSLTSYQVVAALTTLAVLAFLENIGTVWQNIDFLRDLTFYLALSGKAGNFLTGLISSKDVIYFLVITGTFIGLTIVKLQSEREKLNRIRLGLRYAGLVCGAIALLFFSNVPSFIVYFDSTATQSNTVTPTTRQLLRRLNQHPVEITTYVNLLDDSYFIGSPTARNADKNRWEQYTRFNSHLKFNYVYYYDTTIYSRRLMEQFHDRNVRDLAVRMAKINKVDLEDFKSPAEIKKLVDLAPEGNRMVVQMKYGDRSALLRMSDDQEKYPNEAEISAGLKRLLEPAPRIGFLQNEGERNIHKQSSADYQLFFNEQTFRYALINQGFDVVEIQATDTVLPDDLCALVIADPKKNFDEKLMNNLERYVHNGGNLVITTEPGRQHLIAPLCDSIGVQVRGGMLVQQNSKGIPGLIMANFTPAALAWENIISEDGKSKAPVYLPQAAALDIRTDAGFEVTPLLQVTGAQTWNRTQQPVADSLDLSFNEAAGDQRGPFTLAAALQRKINGREQRIIVAGDADFLSNDQLSDPMTGNFALSTAAFRWLARDRFPLDVTPQPSLDNSLTLTAAQFSVMQVLENAVFPALFLVAAAVFLVKRRKK